MSIHLRYMASGPGAFIITVGLGLMMVNLIKVSFVPQEKPEKLGFEINFIPIDEPLIKRQDPPILLKIPPPPSPTKLDIADTDVVIIDWTPMVGKIPDPKPIKIDRGEPFEMLNGDMDEQPIVRIPPVMPMRAEKSGHCKMRFAVSPQGQPFNIIATYCTSSIFKRASIKSVGKWKYNAKVVDGSAVVRRGVETKITFNLTGDRGRRIPE